MGSRLSILFKESLRKFMKYLSKYVNNTRNDACVDELYVRK